MFMESKEVNKMKKIIAILLTLVLTVSLVGCTKNDKKNPQLTNGAQELKMALNM